jgi:hypothetical protein
MLSDPASANQANPDDDDDVRLSAPEGMPAAERIVRSRISPNIVVNRPEPRRQFTIASLLILLTFICVGLSGASWIPATVFAGIVGAALVLVIFSAITSPHETVLSLTIWIGLVLAYVIACVVALLRLAE